MPENFIVIIAGGKGERFWPQSRARRPKHLLPIVGDQPLLAQTLARVRPLAPARNIFIITSEVQAEALREVCPGVPAENIVAEPAGRDTAAAVGLAATLIAARAPRAVFAVLPSDHVIHDVRAYRRDLAAALAAARLEPVMVTIGIKPHEAATGFGYIARGARWATVNRRQFFRVRRFVEKPPQARARRYLASGDYLWNAGMFVWSVPVIQRAFTQFAPELAAGLQHIAGQLAAGRPRARVLADFYPRLPRISVDYAILEKADNVVVLPAAFDWDDVGSWPAVARHHAGDAAGNIVHGRGIVEQGRNNIIYSHGDHLLALLGADDLIVVHTADATLICPRNRAQEIKQLLQRVAGQKDGQRWL